MENKQQQITFDASDVDISNIMSQIHDNLKLRGYDVEELERLSHGLNIKQTVADFSDEQLNTVLSNMNGSSEIKYWWDIPPQNGLKGRLKVFCQKVVRKLTFFYMRHAFDQQNIFNTNVVTSVNQLASTYEKLSAENDTLLMQITSLNNQNTALWSALNKSIANNKELVAETSSELNANVERATEKHLSQISAIEYMYSKRQNAIDSVNIAMAARLARIETTINDDNKNNEHDINQPIPVGHKKEFAFDYFLFESKLRDTSEKIKQSLEHYLPYFSNKGKVLDISCGRGEFLELLAQNGVSAFGVDMSWENIAWCKGIQQDAELCDGIDFLDRCENESLGGIFSSGRIEHIPPEQIIHTIRLAYRKLKSGACLIIESLNPQCLAIYAENLNPSSNLRPIHPLTIKFIAECEGFTDIDITYSSPSNLQIPYIGENQDSSDSHNPDAAISAVNQLIFGSHKYAVIIKK